MAEISADLVKKLRDATNVSMMECKRALVEAGGDMDNATRILRERGIAVAAKKATRTANQGVIAAAAKPDQSVAALVEINCETDFVARNSDFLAFAKDIANKACTTDSPIAEQVKAEVTTRIAQIGENILIKRNTRFVLSGTGTISSYIHLGGKVGVLVELNCVKKETAGNPAFVDLAKDLTLHVTACNPRYLTSAEVPKAEVDAERAIYAKQVENKPPQIVEKIVDGKIKKFYSDVCLVDQLFVKEQKVTITQLLQAKGKELGDTLTVKRFVRWQFGE